MGEPTGEGIIFVGGPPRSGTTLIQNVLDTHPDIFGGPEFDMIPAVVALRDRFHRAIENRRIHAFFDKAELDRRICRFIENLLLPKAQSQGCAYISEKTPSNVLVFSRLMEICPSARCVFVLRDPLAVLASLRRVRRKYRSRGMKPPGFVGNLYSGIDFTRECIRAGFRAHNADPRRVMMVKYEHLVRQPEKATKDLCRHIEIPWHPAMMRPGETAHQGESALDGIWYDKASYYRNIDPSPSENGSGILTPFEQLAVYRAFRSDRAVTGMGYCKEAPEVTIKDRMLYAVTSLLWDACRNARRRLSGRLALA